MKKFKLTTTQTHLRAMCEFIEKGLPLLAISADFAEKCSIVILDEWIESKQTRRMCRYGFEGEKKITLPTQVACALGYFIQAIDFDHSSYLGNYLNNVFHQIHKQYTHHDQSA